MGDDNRLLQDLDGFFTEHRACGDLDGGLDRLTGRRYVIWIECGTCGAKIVRRAIDACEPE